MIKQPNPVFLWPRECSLTSDLATLHNDLNHFNENLREFVDYISMHQHEVKSNREREPRRSTL